MCGFIVACTYPGIASSGKNRLESVATPDAAEGNLKDSVPGLKCSVLQEQLEKSLELIKHRGPDGREVWVNHDATVGLGHCRLAINDTSPTGSQPMHSADGQVHAVVIGEIYGYDELRQYCEALGYSFLGRSDSELVLALYSTHGAPEFFTHLRGEFSFVIVDDRKDERRIIAARDRFGIKPLFWTTHQSQILFAAEAKAFLGMGWTPEWDVESIATSGWLADERTIFQGVKKLAPGHWIEITPRSTSSEPIPQRYWDQQYPSKHPEEHPRKYTRDDIARMIEEVRERLVDAVRVRLRADVPMGLYLSGGIDSSAVAGIVAHLVRNENVKFGSLSVDADDPPRIKCFTVRYTDATYDESGEQTLLSRSYEMKYALILWRPNRGSDADGRMARRAVRAQSRVPQA
jgi:asparagine synthase (glutamine-hydrolysing)